MAPTPVAVVESSGTSAAQFADLVAAGQPAIMRGVVSGWPLVKAAREGMDAAARYLGAFDAGKLVVAYSGPPSINGRFFYTDDLRRLNFEAKQLSWQAFFEALSEIGEMPDPPALYLGSTDLDQFLPGLNSANQLPLDHPIFSQSDVIKSIWIGNRTTAATHYDMSNNIACCVAGKRRFTLFPPDQIANLYPGPLEPTPGGQVVSMVDVARPDLARFPRYNQALAKAQGADLEPGDVLFYPAMWWHNVEALDPFNILINYWWNDVPAFVDSPMTTLLHGLLSLRGRPAQERAAWQHIFDYYLFGEAADATRHLPDHAVRDLGALDEGGARRLRAKVLGRLNR
jgi:Cupin-like domain